MLGDLKKIILYLLTERFLGLTMRVTLILTEIVDFYTVLLKTYTLKPIVFFKKMWNVTKKFYLIGKNFIICNLLIQIFTDRCGHSYSVLCSQVK